MEERNAKTLRCKDARKKEEGRRKKKEERRKKKEERRNECKGSDGA